MILVNTPGSWAYVYPPFKHASWHGCTLTDLVFPFFIFAVGLSMALSLNNNNVSKPNQLKKILKRTINIFAIGLLLNWFPFYYKNIFDIRFFGVLQRIALSYGLAALLVIILQKPKVILATIIIILIGYYKYLSSMGDFTLEGNINSQLDALFLPTKNIYGGFGVKFDPEGLLGVIPSSMQVLIGYLAGQTLIKYKTNLKQLLKISIITGVLLIILAICYLSHYFPINKPLWTSSYVVYTSGIALIFLSVIIYITDIKKYSKWAFPFQVFGRNALFTFVLSGLIVKALIYIFKFGDTNGYNYIFKNIYQPIFGNYLGSLMFAISFVVILYLVALRLYNKNIIIKL